MPTFARIKINQQTSFLPFTKSRKERASFRIEITPQKSLFFFTRSHEEKKKKKEEKEIERKSIYISSPVIKGGGKRETLKRRPTETEYPQKSMSGGEESRGPSDRRRQ